MKPVQTPDCNALYHLAGGTAENDLPIERGYGPDGGPYTISEWELTPPEREALACGGRIQLLMRTHAVPPVALLAVARSSSGDVYVVEEGEKTGGTAVILPAQAERLRAWLGDSISILEGQLAADPNNERIKDTVVEMQDILGDLRPLEDR
jgi:xanthine/CO dehydrogenase XdhC/CoxF family maturation factor